MKLTLSSFFVCFFLLCGHAFGNNVVKTYSIKVNGIKIGKLNWDIKIKNKNYSNNIYLKSEGLLSIMYSFEGKYSSTGDIENKFLSPNNYKHFWKTNKKTKTVSLVFQNNKLKSLNQKPDEKESLRVDVFNIQQTKDPLTAFLQIIMGIKSVLVIDGRRLYTMSAENYKNTNQTLVEIINYSNLWADHKRNKFEKIVFEKKMKTYSLTKYIFILMEGVLSFKKTNFYIF